MTASSYTLSNVNGTFALQDDDPFLAHVSAHTLTKGPLAGWHLAEFCEAGDDSCLLVAVRAETDKIAYIQAASCTGEKCAANDLAEAIAAFENETVELVPPIKAVWTRD